MGLFEGFDHFVTHLETVLADAGSHCCLNAVDSGALTAHFFNHSLGNTSHRATPARMGHGDNAGLTVNQDDGHAIGRIHADDDALQPCHQCVYTLEGRLLLVDI